MHPSLIHCLPSSVEQESGVGLLFCLLFLAADSLCVDRKRSHREGETFPLNTLSFLLPIVTQSSFLTPLASFSSPSYTTAAYIVHQQLDLFLFPAVLFVSFVTRVQTHVSDSRYRHNRTTSPWIRWYGLAASSNGCFTLSAEVRIGYL